MSVRLSMSMNDQGDVRLVSVTPGHDFPQIVKGEVPPVQHLRDGSYYPDPVLATGATCACGDADCPWNKPRSDPHPHDRGWGWLKDDGSTVPVVPNTDGVWTFNDTPSPIIPNPAICEHFALFNSEKLTAIRAELDALDLHATANRDTADLTANLRVLLGLPRETK